MHVTKKLIDFNLKWMFSLNSIENMNINALVLKQNFWNYRFLRDYRVNNEKLCGKRFFFIIFSSLEKIIIKPNNNNISSVLNRSF